jgi:GTPase SAR1 family protein
LVYDLTSPSSFDTLDFWYDSIKKSTNDDIVIHLIGNKSDLIKDRKVSKEKAVQFLMKHNIQGYSECSAKNNTNIKDTFVSYYKSKFFIFKI